MFPCHEEKIKWDDYGEFIRCVLTFSTDKSHDVPLWFLLQSRILKVEFLYHHLSKKSIFTVNSLCLIALKCENKLYRHSQQIKKINSYDQLNHCCEQSVRAQAAQTHVIKGVSVHHRYTLSTRLFL